MAGTLSTIAPQSADRKKLARTFLATSQTFSTLSIPDLADTSNEPIDYESTRRFDADINSYYRFHIDYTPYFERRWNILRPASWLYYIDITDEIIEQKFPRDQDMRAVITAFRYTIQQNRRRIIALKRAVQAIGSAVLFLPALALAIAPGSTGNPIAVAALIAAAVVITAGLGFYQYLRDSQLKSILQSNGRTLASQIQNRANDLNRHFLEFFARIDREELNDDMTNPEWTHRSAWWMKLCMWYPRRIESIELFLQSEMQRTRIFMLRSAWLGYGSALLLLVLIPALFALVVLFINRDPGTFAAVWWLWLFGAVASIPLMLYSIRTSIGLTNIAEAVGKEPLGHSSRFADLDLHNKLAGQIRRDKEGLRQANLRGGYGENRNRG